MGAMMGTTCVDTKKVVHSTVAEDVVATLIDDLHTAQNGIDELEKRLGLVLRHIVSAVESQDVPALSDETDLLCLFERLRCEILLVNKKILFLKENVSL